MSGPVKFFVPGIPVSAGSKRAFKTKTGKVIMVPASNKQRPWMDSVRWAAINAFERQVKIEGPISLEAIFVLPRPKGHYGTGKNLGILKKNAPAFCATRPDLSKLVRAIEDSITSIIWRDDSQVVETKASKIYGETPGVHITIAGWWDAARKIDEAISQYRQALGKFYE